MESLQTIFNYKAHKQSGNKKCRMINMLEIDFPNFLKQLTNTAQSRCSIRIRASENKLSKSFEIKQQNLTNPRQQQRRKSGIEQLSDKQLRIDCLYPKTFIQHDYQLQRTKERKKTIFKRMSSILIKHQTTLKNIGNKNSENQLLLLQQALPEKQPDDLTPQSIIKKKMFRSSLLENETSKVVLNLQKKQNKAFASIKSYMNEKSLIVNSQNPFLNYMPSQSLTEMNHQIQSPSTQRKSCRLPDLKLSARICNTEIGKLKHNNVYCSQSLKKKRAIKLI